MRVPWKLVAMVALALWLGALYTRGARQAVMAPLRASQVDVGPDLRLGDDLRPRPDSAPWWRYATIAGLAHLSDDPRLAADRKQARALLERVQRIATLSRAADYLWPTAFDVLTPTQRAWLLDNVRLPCGLCTCPCAPDNPVVKKVAGILAARAGSAPLPPFRLPAQLPPDPVEEVPSGLRLLEGMLEMDAVPALRVTPQQARRLLPILALGVEALATIRDDMQALRGDLTPAQEAWIRERASGWMGTLTGEQLDAQWETWERQALAGLQAAAR